MSFTQQILPSEKPFLTIPTISIPPAPIPVRYDVLSINIGSAPSLNAQQRVHANLAPVKPIDGFSARWNIILKRVSRIGARRLRLF